jgi:hypothetical protein
LCAHAASWTSRCAALFVERFIAFVLSGFCCVPHLVIALGLRCLLDGAGQQCGDSVAALRHQHLPWCAATRSAPLPTHSAVLTIPPPCACSPACTQHRLRDGRCTAPPSRVVLCLLLLLSTHFALLHHPWPVLFCSHNTGCGAAGAPHRLHAWRCVCFCFPQLILPCFTLRLFSFVHTTQAAGRPVHRTAFTRGAADGSLLFNPFDLKMKNVANTGVLHWGGKLLALYEVCAGWRVEGRAGWLGWDWTQAASKGLTHGRHLPLLRSASAYAYCLWDDCTSAHA